MLNRRDFLGSVTLAATLLPYRAGAFAGNGERRKPNVIYCFSDEHRWQSMSFSEMPEVHTPNIAQLAKEGISFTNCISNYPVCSPYRGICLTGRWPYQTGVIDNGLPLSSDEVTIGKVFQAADYRTGYIGKWHLGGNRAEPFGFDHSLIWTRTNSHWDSTYHPSKLPRVRVQGKYNATVMTDQALDFIQRQPGRPFFLMLSLNPPHAIFTDPPDAQKAIYANQGSLKYRPNVPAPAELSTSDRKRPRLHLGAGNWPSYQGYHAHITAVDEELGRVMTRLTELGLSDDTILVYTSDHGSMMGSHGLGGKRQPFEESIRVPFLVRWPVEVPADVRADSLFGSIDIMPTVCALAGLPIPEKCQGLDFSETLLGHRGPDPDAQLIMHISKEHASGGQNHPAPLFRGLRTKQHTYAVYPDGPWCLFDNVTDPFQQVNRIDDPKLSGLRSRLNKNLADRLKRAEDPISLPT